MTRKKTISFSLKVLWARLQRLHLSYRIAVAGIALAVLLLNSLLMPGCTQTIPLPLGAEIDGFVLKKEEMENVRFEPQGLPFSIEPARAYWLRRGDAIAPRWGTYEWHWERKGAMPMCGFVDNTSAGDCQVCDFCNPPASFDGPPCMGWNTTNVNFGPGILEVVADSGFIQTDNPQLVIDLRNNIFAGCSNATQGPLGFFAPTASGLYRLRSDVGEAFKINGATNGEIKLHVVEPGAGLAQMTAYDLDGDKVSEVEDLLDSNGNPVLDGNGDPIKITHLYWTWTMKGSPLWMENFSQNLQVTDIRIYKGICADGSAQGKQCAIPNERVPVKPSRILFLENFQGTVSVHPLEETRRCYNNTPTMGDFNFINLASCRTTCDADQMACTSTQISQKSPTPAYDPADYVAAMNGMPERLPGRLTWLVEFNTSEGADADLMMTGIQSMMPNDVLIIEFTIQAKPI